MATLANPRPVVCASQRANVSGSSSLLAHHIIQKGAFAPRRSNTSSRHPASLRTRPSAKKEGAQKKAVKPTVPDAPPSKGPSEQANAVEESYERADTVASTTAAEGEQTATTEPLSVDEIAQQMAELRAERQQRPSKEGLVEGVLEEIGLIKWPSPQTAFVNTLLVIAIVGGTSAVLFGVNTLLNEISKEVYSRL